MSLQEFPKFMFAEGGKSRVVRTAEDVAALPDGPWYDTPELHDMPMSEVSVPVAVAPGYEPQEYPKVVYGPDGKGRRVQSAADVGPDEFEDPGCTIPATVAPPTGAQPSSPAPEPEPVAVGEEPRRRTRRTDA